jgi:predicted aspartyl protease
MRIRRIALLAMVLAVTGFGSSAQTCGLVQMASLDITMLPEGRIAVPVTINGTPREFMVDTAGVYSSVSDDLVRALGMKKTATGGKIYGVGGSTSIFSVKADSFMIGKNEAKDFHFIVDNPYAGAKYDGVLAADMLTLFDVDIDMANKKLNLFSQDHCPGKVVYWTRSGYAELPFRLSGSVVSGNRDNHIDVTMQLDGHDLSTNVDTGSFRTWVRMKAASRTLGFDESAPGVERESKADDIAVYKGQFKSLTMGGVTVNNPAIDIIADKMEDAYRMEHSEKSRDDPVYGQELSVEDLYLGMTTISKLHMYIAYKERKLYITAVDAH